MNLIGLILLLISAVGFAIVIHLLRPQIFSTGFEFSSNSLGQSLVFILELIAVTFVMILLHESFHGLFFWIFSNTRPAFAFKIYYAYAAAPDWYFPRWQYFIIGLAPLVGLTLFGILGVILLPAGFLMPIYLLLVFNTSGAVGDLWVMAKLSSCPAETLIQDHGDSIAFFKPT